MVSITLSDGKTITNYGKPYIIAEMNSSHSGDMDTAKEMIDSAAQAGADCVKFQSWSKETLYSKTYYDQNRVASRIVGKLSFNSDQLKELAEYSRRIGIDFSSTPYSEDEVDFLCDINVPFIKIASMELNNPDFLEYIAQKGLPMILSTGMGEMSEIEKAVNVIESTGNKKLIILHCVSIYPAKDENIDLNNIVGLRKRFPDYPIGFSDHTLGITASVGAVALGAGVIEKHFTLSKKAVGMDVKMAMEPKEFSELVQGCHMVHKALGSEERTVLSEEYEQRRNMRRSIVSVRDIEEGELISENHICFKRPGIGYAPTEKNTVIGKKAGRKIEADTVILESDLV